MFITRQIPRDSYRAGGPRGSSTWTQTVNVSGYPTVEWKKDESPPTTSREVVGETVDKLGAYRGQSSFPISIWQDGYCGATSFSAAASCLRAASPGSFVNPERWRSGGAD